MAPAWHLGSRAACRPPRACAAPRAAPARRLLPAVRGVQFSDSFMDILQKSLEREEHRIAEKVGIPSLFIHESVEHEDGEDGSGGIMWPAGIRLSRHLVQNRRQELRGARVLEIGCGTGLVGLSAACLGAHVMLTDKREVLPGIVENVEANAALVEAAGGSATVVELDWDEPDADPDVMDQDYDWILGADVTYDPARMPKLAKLLRQMVLTNPEAVVKLAHMHRSKDTDRAMRELFAEEGLLLRPVDVRTTATTEYDDPIRADESIVFYRVAIDDNRRYLSGRGGSSGADEQEQEGDYHHHQQQHEEEEEPSSSSSSSDWQAVQDEEGRTYYYNAATGVTQWECPDELA